MLIPCLFQNKYWEALNDTSQWQVQHKYKGLFLHAEGKQAVKSQFQSRVGARIAFGSKEELEKWKKIHPRVWVLRGEVFQDALDPEVVKDKKHTLKFTHFLKSSLSICSCPRPDTRRDDLWGLIQHQLIYTFSFQLSRYRRNAFMLTI